MRDIIATIRDVVDNVTLGVTVVGAVTLVGGILILVGAVAMTKFQRVYEAAIYRTLGASARTRGGHAGRGVRAARAPWLGSSGRSGRWCLSWALSTYLFEIDWHSGARPARRRRRCTAVLVAVVGVVASLDVLAAEAAGDAAERVSHAVPF